MAEKSSQLDNIKAIDTDSTEEMLRDDTSLMTRTDDDFQTTDLATRDDDTDDADDTVTDETEQLREQIEETRRGMGETIDAIQERLSFQNISDQVKDQVSEQINGAVESAKDAFYGKAGDLVNTVSRTFRDLSKTDLAKRAQQNPTALAIIGAGIGALLIGLLVDGKKGGRKTKSYNYDYDSSDDQVRYTDAPRRELSSSRSDWQSESTFESGRNRIGDTASSGYESVSGAASSAYGGVTSAAGSAIESLGNAASATYEGVGSVAGKTYEGVGNVASKTYKGVTTAAGFAYEKAGDLGGQVKINYDHYIEENPLAVGAVALALGAVVGFAIPMTQKENEYLGEYRDTVVEKAQETAQEALGTVKQMATEAQRVITEEVQSQTASQT
jgi:hypothetical protein